MRFVDANVFIYHLASDPKFGKVSKQILFRIQNGDESALTSTIVISQVCSYLKWKRKAEAHPPVSGISPIVADSNKGRNYICGLFRGSLPLRIFVLGTGMTW